MPEFFPAQRNKELSRSIRIALGRAVLSTEYTENQNQVSECFRGKWVCSRSKLVIICGRHKVSHAPAKFNGNQKGNNLLKDKV